MHGVTYAWRSDNRLLSISNASTKIFYGYNPQGQRIKRYVVKGGVTTKTHYTLDTQRPYSEVLSEATQVGSSAWSTQHNAFTPDGLGDLLQSGQHQVFAGGPWHVETGAAWSRRSGSSPNPIRAAAPGRSAHALFLMGQVPSCSQPDTQRCARLVKDGSRCHCALVLA